MGEVDTPYSIKHPYKLIEIFRDILESIGIKDADDLKGYIKTSGIYTSKNSLSLDEIIDFSFDESKKSKTNVMKRYRLRVNELFNSIENLDALNRIPILVNGLCLTDYIKKVKKGIDPYSLNHLMTNFLINHSAENISEKARDSFYFMFMQPAMFAGFLNDEWEFEDIIKEVTKKRINPRLSGIKYGDLIKRSGQTEWIGNANYNPNLFSVKTDKILLGQTPDLLSEKLKLDGKINYTRYKRERMLETYLCKHLMGITFSEFIKKTIPKFNNKMKEYGIREIPIFMEKSSDSAEIIKIASKYYKFKYSFIGGEGGILAGQKMPFEGIVHRAAISRLFGFMNASTNSNVKRFNFIQSEKNTLKYHKKGRYPWMLLENGTEKNSPNAHDVIDDLRNYWNKKNRKIAEMAFRETKKFCYENRLGFKRIEPRLVELFVSNPAVYLGFRNQNKLNVKWENEYKNKKIVIPLQVNNFKEMPCLKYGEKTDIRGSEWSNTTNPKFNEEWMKDYRNGVIDIGCTIEKLISGMSHRIFIEKLERNLKNQDQEVNERYKKSYDKETKEPISAVRGTFIHEIISRPLDNLVHYDTLKKIGLDPVSSDQYTETGFSHQVNGVRVSLKPDCYLLLKRKDGSHDIIIMDTKTNRITPYPEHKYLTQGFCYGYVISDAIKKYLNIEMKNIYVVLNKNAFYRNFDDEIPINPPHSNFRSQQYSPIVLFKPDHFMFDAMPKMLELCTNEKNQIKEDANYFVKFKSYFEKANKCKCFESTKLVCDQMKEDYLNGADISKELFTKKKYFL